MTIIDKTEDEIDYLEGESTAEKENWADIIDWDNYPDMLDEISKYIFTSKYARYLPKLQRRETWEEAVDRVQSMHLKRFRGDKLTAAQRARVRWAFNLVGEKKVLPSMRSFQFGGAAIEANHLRCYNCAVRHVDSIRAFAEVFFLLLCGSGVGLGITKKHVNRIPALVNVSDRTGAVLTYAIEDTIEGWADSVEALLLCYTRNNPFTGRKIAFDYSKIRPKGAPLRVGGGKAPGYEPLKAAHLRIKRLLEQCIEERGQNRLRPIDVYDILMHTSDAVISGGVRRSATIVIFDKDDEEMLSAKTGNWFDENPQRARSNNSVLLLRNQISFEEFQTIIQRTKEFGEPGFIFADHEDALYNPCFTADQKVLTDEGWRSFDQLLGTTPTIHQDVRIVGSLVDGEEEWNLTGLRGGTTTTNIATKVMQTGEQQDIFRLTMSCGREVRATSNHRFATDKGMVELCDLKPGDKVFVGTPDVYSPKDISTSDRNLGFLAGLCAGDGGFSYNGLNVYLDMWETEGREGDTAQVTQMVKEVLNETSVELGRKGGAHLKLEPEFHLATKTGNYNKYRLQSMALGQIFASLGFTTKVGDWSWLHGQNKEFKAGFISGLFYADGDFHGNTSRKTITFQISQSNKPALQTVQLVLQELGIMARVHKSREAGLTSLPNGKGGYSDYQRKASFRLLSHGKESIGRAMKWIDLFPYDSSRLAELIDSVYGGSLEVKQGTRYYSKVVDVIPDGVEDVYCLQENVRRTMIVSGLTVTRCAEIQFIPVTKDGRTGVQVCNLTSINGALVKSEQDFLDAAEAASIIGTLQATYTLFPYLNAASEELTKEEALLGVSMTAMMENPTLLLDPVLQQRAATKAVETNKKWAEILGIKQAARVTCIKPEGSGSLVVGTMASGIHAAEDHWMFRRIQANKIDPVYMHFKETNPHMCEESVWSANKSDDVITFPVRVSDSAMVKRDLDALSHLDMIKSTQENWVLTGTTEVNQKPVTHNVSCTVRVTDHEWEQVTNYLYLNRGFFGAVSLLPANGDKIYAQAPVESVGTEEEFQHYHKLLKNMKQVDYTTLVETEDATELQQELACGGGQCEL